MTTFDERGAAFENKFKHDKELEFKVNNRRNKLLGLWAAELLGIDGDEAVAYAKAVVNTDFDEPGDGDVFRKILGDFKAKKVDVSEHRLRKQMDELLVIAKQQMMSES